MLDWFKKQSELVQFLLLIIPFVGWVMELILRWSRVIEEGGALNIVVALVYTIFGWAWILGVIDAVLCLLGKGLLFIDVK